MIEQTSTRSPNFWVDPLNLFPPHEYINKAQIDKESMRYISTYSQAEEISDIIVNEYQKKGHTVETATITDMTAGVGGNVISFSKRFAYVNAIEIIPLRCQYLQSNLKLYGCNNTLVFDGNCEKIIFNLQQDIIFIDPPWEPHGVKYKKQKQLRLQFNNKCISEFCKNLKILNPKLIVLKLPPNYDIEYLKTQINIINVYKLNKMMIVCL